ETAPRLYPRARPKARYDRSLELFRRSREISPETPVKSGLMVGLGETIDEVVQVLRDLRANGVDLITVGQYLRPTPMHLPVRRFVTPEAFEHVRPAGVDLGISHVESGPCVRSSYHDGEQPHAARTR